MLLAEYLTRPEPVLTEERTEWAAFLDWQAQALKNSSFRSSRPIPATKPLLNLLICDLDGRVWMLRHTRAVRGRPVPFVAVSSGQVRSPMHEYFEPPVFAVFGVNGTYLGEVRFPVGAKYISFAGDVAWGVTTDDDGQEFLTRWRVPAASARQ